MSDQLDDHDNHGGGPTQRTPFTVSLHLTVNIAADRLVQAQGLAIALASLGQPDPAAVLAHAEAMLSAGLTERPIPEEEPVTLADVVPMTTDRKPWKERIVEHLREHGPIEERSGRAVGVLQEQLGATCTRQRFTAIVSDLVADGVLVREANARRTFRLAVAEQSPSIDEAIVEEAPAEPMGTYVDDDELEPDEKYDGKAGPLAMKSPLNANRQHQAAAKRDRPDPSGLAFEKRPFDPEAVRMRGIRAAWGDD